MDSINDPVNLREIQVFHLRCRGDPVAASHDGYRRVKVIKRESLNVTCNCMKE